MKINVHPVGQYPQFVGKTPALIYQTKWHHIQRLQYMLEIYKDYSKSNGPNVLMGM
jgi:hypothetical protein